jgi:hypothetical protein
VDDAQILDTLQASASVCVAASAEQLYEMVADVTRMGEWSPVCVACTWDDGAGPEPGAWFTGYNEAPEGSTARALGGSRTPVAWDRRCQVVAADPGNEFAFVNGGAAEGYARWSYAFRPTEEGTEVEERWKVLRVTEHMRAVPDRELRRSVDLTTANIVLTLSRLKAAAEAAAS